MAKIKVGDLEIETTEEVESLWNPLSESDKSLLIMVSRNWQKDIGSFIREALLPKKEPILKNDCKMVCIDEKCSYRDRDEIPCVWLIGRNYIDALRMGKPSRCAYIKMVEKY